MTGRYFMVCCLSCGREVSVHCTSKRGSRFCHRCRTHGYDNMGTEDRGRKFLPGAGFEPAITLDFNPDWKDEDKTKYRR